MLARGLCHPRVMSTLYFSEEDISHNRENDSIEQNEGKRYSNNRTKNNNRARRCCMKTTCILSSAYKKINPKI